MAQSAAQNDCSAAGIAGRGDLVGDRAEQGRAQQIVRPVLHCQDRDRSFLLADDGGFFHRCHSCFEVIASTFMFCWGHTKASRCLATKASTVSGGRPPILSTKSLVPANTPLV